MTVLIVLVLCALAMYLGELRKDAYGGGYISGTIFLACAAAIWVLFLA